MEDLIKRSDVIDAVIKAEVRASIYYKPNWDMVKKFIADIPSADRSQGEWIYTDNPLRLDDEWACSRCGNISFMRTNFCDRCGAQMEGADDE